MGAGSTDVIDPGVGGDTPPAPEWLAALPDELRSAKSLARYADVSALAKGHVELERTLGAPLKPPSADAKPEEWARYRSRIGAPESPDKYEITKPEGLPEGMTWDDALVTSFQTLAHKIGLTQDQVRALADFDTTRQLGIVDRATGSIAASRKQAEEALKQAWGPQVYPRNAGLAKQALDHFTADDPEIRSFIEDEHGNDPRVIKLWHKVGEALLEDGEITGQPLASAGDVQAKIDAMKNDPKHPVNDANHPQYAASIDELLALYRQLPGGREPVFTAVGRDK